MMSLSPSVVVILACWGFTSQVKAESPVVSKNVLDFMNVYNGVIDNSKEIQAGAEDVDNLKAILKPVQVPAFGDTPVLYLEESKNNEVYRRHLVAVSEDSRSRIVLTLYNLTDSSLFDSGNWDFSRLSTLKPEDLHTDTECRPTFEPVGPGFFVGSWIDCRHTISGHHPAYTVTATCTGITFTPPEAAGEHTGNEPYALLRQGDRFPVFGAPDDYVSPCDQ